MEGDLSSAEISRYEALCIEMKNRKLREDEDNELQRLAIRYSVQLKREGEEHRAARKLQLDAEAKEKRAKSNAGDLERDLLHQVSYLKSVLNPKVDDTTLKQRWIEFKASVE